MALLIIFFTVVVFVIFILNFIFLGPIISSSDNIIFPPLNGGDLLYADKTRILFELCGNFIKQDCYSKPILFYTGKNPSYELYNNYSNRDVIMSQPLTSEAYICFHGFNSDASEFLDIKEKYNDKTFISFNLPGVSYKPGSFINVTTQEYMFYIYNIISQIDFVYNNITILASSTSCTYIIWFLYRFRCYHNFIKEVIFFSPNIEFFLIEKNISQVALYPFGKKMISLLDQRMFTKNNTEYFDSYQFIHLIGIMGMVRKIKYKLGESVPSLKIYYTSKDKVVDPKATVDFYEKYKGIKEIHDTKSENHNILPIVSKFII